MKISLSPIALLIIPAILGLPAIVPAEAAAAAAPIDNPHIEARAAKAIPIEGTIRGNGIHCRGCRRLSCGTLAVLNQGDAINVVCWDNKNADTVNGDARWVSASRIGLGGFWVPFGSVYTNKQIPAC